MEYDDAVEFGIARKKLHVIPMGIDVPATTPSEAREDDGTLNILFVGRIARVRRLELLLQAVHRLAIPWRLTIVGGEEKTSSLSKSGYLAELQQLCAALKIETQVHFTGAKRPQELPEIYRAADVFVYPSLYENFAQPILEAAAYGLPVIATPVGVAPEIIAEAETGFLVAADAADFCRRLEQLKDSSLRADMGAKIKEAVRKKFDWNSIMDHYMELYRSF